MVATCQKPFTYILHVVVSPPVTFQNRFSLLTCLPGKTQNSKTSRKTATGGILVSSYFYQIFPNKNIKMSSFKSSENIQKKEGGSDRSVSD